MTWRRVLWFGPAVLALLWLSPVDPDAAPRAGSGSGGGTSTQFVCDSFERRCECFDYYDCKRMQEKICGKKQMTCTAKKCHCAWEPTGKPAGRGRIDLPPRRGILK